MEVWLKFDLTCPEDLADFERVRTSRSKKPAATDIPGRPEALQPVNPVIPDDPGKDNRIIPADLSDKTLRLMSKELLEKTNRSEDELFAQVSYMLGEVGAESFAACNQAQLATMYLKLKKELEAADIEHTF